VEWSYRLLDQTQRRVFRAVSVFPAGFTLEAAEAVAGSGAAQAVLRLVDCSLLTPPRDGPDGRARYGMLETLRAYGTRLLDGAGEREQATAALARYAVAVAEQAAAGLQTRTGERDAARWLDAEGAAIWQALAWAVAHDLAVAERLVDALGWWWTSRGRLPAVVPLLGELAGRAEPGSDQWCTAQFWLGYAAQDAADYARAGGTTPRCGTRWQAGRRPGRWPTAWAAGPPRWRAWRAGSPRRPGRPASRWRWPGRLATRSWRCWPC
jgi:hypothetical protein